jgi:hypothetical protein
MQGGGQRPAQQDRRKSAHLAGFNCSHCSHLKTVCSHTQWEQNSSMLTTTYARFWGLFPLFPRKKNDPPKETAKSEAHPVPWRPTFCGFRLPGGDPPGIPRYSPELAGAGVFGGGRWQVEPAPVGGCTVARCAWCEPGSPAPRQRSAPHPPVLGPPGGCRLRVIHGPRLRQFVQREKGVR